MPKPRMGARFGFDRRDISRLIPAHNRQYADLVLVALSDEDIRFVTIRIPASPAEFTESEFLYYKS